MYTEISNPEDYRAAFYIRLSKEDEPVPGAMPFAGESQSITNQRSMLQAFASKQCLQVVDEYIDDGWSGGNFDRPEFQRLIRDIEAKKVNMVITKDLSRLGRDYIQTGHYTERYFPEHQVRYISLLDGIDTGVESAMNDITPFKAIMNDMYAKDISKKIKSVKHDQQRKGLFIGGKAPYGYRLSPTKKNTLTVDEPAAAVVKEIFRKALSGASCRSIAAALNNQGIPPPAVYANQSRARKGVFTGLWSAERVTYTLKNEMYAGNMVQGRTKKVNYKSKKCVKVPKQQWIVVEDTHPAIIAKEDFAQVQRLLESRSQTRARTHDYLLKGLVYCKECGYPLGVISRTLSGNRPTLYFLCRTYSRFTNLNYCTSHCIRVETVTERLTAQIEEICRRSIDRQRLCTLAAALHQETLSEHPQENTSAQIVSQIADITANMDRIYADKLSGLLDEVDFQRLYIKFKQEREQLQKGLDALQENGAPRLGSDDLDALTEHFIQTASENRALICSLIDKIELTQDKELHIHFRVSEE